jgi:hypothetical protein
MQKAKIDWLEMRIYSPLELQSGRTSVQSPVVRMVW